MNRPLRMSLAGAAVMAALAAFASPAKATLYIAYDDGSGPVVVADNGVGDTNPLVGAITVAVGTTNWAGSLGLLGQPLVSNQPHIDFTGGLTSLTAGATLQTWAWDDSFSGSLHGNLTGLLSMTLAGPALAEVNVFKQELPADQPPESPWTISDGNEYFNLGSSSIGFADNFSAGHGPLGPFLIGGYVALLHADAGDTSSWNLEIQNVAPEPSTVVMALAGLPLLGLGVARRLRKSS